MVKLASVVTPERFAKGFVYKDYIAQIKVNKDQFENWYNTFQLKPEDAELFRQAVHRPDGPAKVLALGEDWCPDVYRGLPVLAKVAEASGIELRIFPRDQNLDIMEEFLMKGQFQSIPTIVFYTRDLRYICHWHERPLIANLQRAEIEKEVRASLPGASDQDVRAEMRKRTLVLYPAWQQETVKGWRELLSQHPR